LKKRGAGVTQRDRERSGASKMESQPMASPRNGFAWRLKSEPGFLNSGFGLLGAACLRFGSSFFSADFEAVKVGRTTATLFDFVVLLAHKLNEIGGT
jgi:hypothetical protein